MPTYRSLAVVLKRRDYRESDRWISVCTEKMGKVELIAKGVKNIKSKMAGHLEPFAVVDIMVARGKLRDRVAGCSLKENFSNIRSSLEGMTFTNYFNEAADLVTRPHQNDPQVFLYLKTFYRKLDIMLMEKQRPDFIFLSVQSFLLRFLSLEGFRPVMERCCYCHNALKEEHNYFSMAHLSAVCPACANKENGLKNLEPSAVKILRLMLTDNFYRLKLARISKDLYSSVTLLANGIAEAVAERKLNSFALAQQLALAPV